MCRLVLLILVLLAVGHAATVRIALTQAGPSPPPGVMSPADLSLTANLALMTLTNTTGWLNNNVTVVATIDRSTMTESATVAAAQAFGVCPKLEQNRGELSEISL
jgi:hypothetical protein